MKSIVLFLLLALFMASSIQAGESGLIKAEDAAKLLSAPVKKPLLIDVRTEEEFQAGHLPEAMNINLFGAGFDREIRKLPKDRPLLVYCRTGKRSAGAIEELKRAGYENALDLDGGILAWERKGLPVEKGGSPVRKD